VTDQSGCQNTDKVLIHYLFPLEHGVQIVDAGPVSCCDPERILYAVYGCRNGEQLESREGFPAGTTIEWSQNAVIIPAGQSPFPESSQTVFAVADPGETVSLTVTLRCLQTYTADIVVPQTPPPQAALLQAISPDNYVAPNMFAPSSTIPLRTHFNILEWGPPRGTLGAYSATDYRFFVWGENNQLIYSQEGSGCGFPNGNIPNWNGDDGWGDPLMEDTYVYQFFLKNCVSTTWQLVLDGTVFLCRNLDLCGTE